MMKRSTPITDGFAGLVVHQLTTGYASAPRVIDQLSFRAPVGQVTAVVGANGSGKSTLLKALVGLLPMSSGQVRLNQQLISDWLAQSLVGFVPQHLASLEVVAITAGEFITLSLVTCREQRHTHAHIVHDLADWLAVTELLDKPLRDLSGGQLRRVLLARALVHQPKLLLLDEPEAGLDTSAQQLLVKRLQEYARQQHAVVLVATHAHDLFATAASNTVNLSGDTHVDAV